MKYEKGSFIIVPNRASVLGVSGMSQALYMWLCFHANQDGECFPSRSTLAEYLHCSVRSIDEYIKELSEAGLVIKENRFNDNEQSTNKYILPLWGGVKFAPPRANSALPRANSAHPPVQILRTELNPIELNPINSFGETDVSQIVEVKDTPKPRESKSKYPNAKSVFELWGAFPRGWLANKTQLLAAENLFSERGLEECAEALSWYRKHMHEEFCPQIDSPHDLYTKFTKLDRYYDKHA